jgi:hypothetical protein
MTAAPWQGPPSDVLGGAVPIQRFVARRKDVVVALVGATAFPQGCIFDVHVAARRGSLSDEVWTGVVGGGFEAWPSGADLMFSVRTPGVAEDPFAGNPPEAPHLFQAGRESSHGGGVYESKRRLWLWPLPPARPIEFVVEWPQLGLAPTATTIDGAAVVRAAERAEPYWP